jgi:hypothetical protein
MTSYDLITLSPWYKTDCRTVSIDFFIVPTIAPNPRAVHPPDRGRVVEFPELGGLHHHYERLAA